MGRFSVWTQVGCASGLLGLQAQCRLCTRVASPDLRLKTDEIETDRNQFGRIELCEICVQAITDVCLPSKAETMDQGDICILLEVCQVRKIKTWKLDSDTTPGVVCRGFANVH